MTTVRAIAMLPLVASTFVAQTPDFRNTTWGLDRAQVMAIEGTPPSKIGEVGGEIVLRYKSARLAGLDCRVVYIFAKDKLVRTNTYFSKSTIRRTTILLISRW